MPKTLSFDNETLYNVKEDGGCQVSKVCRAWQSVVGDSFCLRQEENALDLGMWKRIAVMVS